MNRPFGAQRGPGRYASPAVAYAVLDGLVQQALLHQLAGREEAGHELKENVSRILGTLAVEPG